jgi:CheY-like chemotaxis protein
MRGLGLGLAISKGIIDATGGKVTAESEGPEGGATFIVELPVHAREAATPTEASTSPEAPVSEHPRVLLVEDDKDTREMLQDLLSEFGLQVDTADSVASALHEFGEHNFDVVLSDLGLPDGSGLDLVQKLRAIRPVRAIALSGYGMAEDVSRSQAAGFFAHLTKPVSIEKLEAAIHEAVQHGA